ncbi:MAG: CBS domain-containing protein [Halorhodospira sp.]
MSEQQQSIVRVIEVMQDNLILLNGLVTVRDALVKMKETGDKAVLVDKRDENDEYGLVLLSDIAKQVLAHNRAPARVNLYEVMSKPVVSVRSTMDIRYCARLFERMGIAVAPVIDIDEVLGMVRYEDLVLSGMVP